MRLKDNPFCILGVTPCDTVDVITEAAENKKFDDDENEQIYEEARSILVSPVKRLDAEIRYPIEYSCEETFDYRSIGDVVELVKNGNSYADLTFDYDLSNVIIDIEQLYYETKENMQYVIEHLDYSYKEVYDDEKIDRVLEECNLSREVSEFPRCDREAIVGAIRSLKGDVQSGINDLFKRFDIDYSITLANDVAEYLINQEKSYGDVLEIFLSEYAIAVSEVLSSRKDKVLELIEEARNYSTVDELADLKKAASDFDCVAQPLQLLLRDRGQSSSQQESVEIGNGIRALALYYYNEKHLPEMSVYLTDLNIKLFSELTQFCELLKRDKTILADNIEYEKIQDDFLECKEHLDKYLKRVRGWTNSNAETVREILPKMKSTVSKMEKYMQKTCDNAGMTADEMNKILWSVYIQYGDACLWGALWDEVFYFYDCAMHYAGRLQGTNDVMLTSERIDIARREKQSSLRSDVYYPPANSYLSSETDLQDIVTHQHHLKKDNEVQIQPIEQKKEKIEETIKNRTSDKVKKSEEGHGLTGAMIGGALGAAVGGPIGALVGGAIGGWLGKK